MESPIKILGNVSYLNAHQRPGKAGIVTTGHGSILEGNDEAARLLNVISARSMRNAPIVSYAHRSSAQVFREQLNLLKTQDSLVTNLLVLRPRGGVPFRANVTAKVIARGNQILLIFWEISAASLSGNLKIA